MKRIGDYANDLSEHNRKMADEELDRQRERMGEIIAAALKAGNEEMGKPLDCVGLPLTAQVGKHDFIKLTPKEAQDKGLILEEGDGTIAHIGQKYVDPKDWTKTKVDMKIPVYTDLEASLLASLRQVRDLLVLEQRLYPGMFEMSDNLEKALKETHSILSDHEVHS